MNQIQISSKFVAVINLLMIGKVIIPNKGLEALGRLAVITLDQDQDLDRSVELNPVDTIGTVQGQDLILSPEILDNMMVVQDPDLTLEIFVTKNIFPGQTAPANTPDPDEVLLVETLEVGLLTVKIAINRAMKLEIVLASR